MTISWEFWAIVGGVVGLLTFWITYFRRPNEEKKLLIITFKANQKLSQCNIDNVEKLATEVVGWDADFSAGMSYKMAYELMIENHNRYLSDEILNRVLSERLSVSLIASMQRSLDDQMKGLQQYEASINAVWKALDIHKNKTST